MGRCNAAPCPRLLRADALLTGAVEVVDLVGGELAEVGPVRRPDIHVDRYAIFDRRRLGPVLHVRRDAPDAAGRAGDDLITDVQLHAAFHDHEDLLVRMAVRAGIHVRMQFRISDPYILAAEYALHDPLARLAHGYRLPVVVGYERHCLLAHDALPPESTRPVAGARRHDRAAGGIVKRPARR